MGHTFRDVINLLAQTNQDLLDGRIELKIAKAIALNTQVLINASRLHFDACKYQNYLDTKFFDINPAGLETDKRVIVVEKSEPEKKSITQVKTYKEHEGRQLIRDKNNTMQVKKTCKNCEFYYDCKDIPICKDMNLLEGWTERDISRLKENTDDM